MREYPTYVAYIPFELGGLPTFKSGYINSGFKSGQIRSTSKEDCL